MSTEKSETRDPIEYLLNAMEAAAQSGNPFAAGYGGKRQAVLTAIVTLRADLATARRVCTEAVDELTAANRATLDALEQRNAEVRIRQAAEKSLTAANQRAERAEKDATRYRYWRNVCLGRFTIQLLTSPRVAWLKFDPSMPPVFPIPNADPGKECDVAIDAALKAQVGGEGK